MIRAGWPKVLVGVIVLGAVAAVLASRHVDPPPPMDQLSDADLHPSREPPIVKPQHVEPQRELPPWFGDTAAPPVVIDGRVVGVTEPTTVRLAVDVPNPMIWTGREVAVGADGQFDFGPMRRGRYLLVAYGARNSARVTPVDTTANPGHVDLFEYPCQRFHERVRRFGGDNPVAGVPIEIAGRVAATTDEQGDFTVCAQERADLTLGEAGREQHQQGRCTEECWDEAIRYEVAAPYRTSGTVLDVDGSPAAHVGVQPIWRTFFGYRCWKGNTAVTTDEHGRFDMDGYPALCGVQIIRGTAIYSTLQDGPFQLESTVTARLEQLPFPSKEIRIELHKPDPATALPDRISGRRHWIRGSVRRGKVPVADALVELSVDFPWPVLPHTYSALDGTFAIAIPSALEDPYFTLEIRATKPREHLASHDRALQRKSGDLNGVVITVTARPAAAHDH